MMNKYKIRFHLARGEHYMHWQIKGSDNSVQYVDPAQYQIEMTGCKLVNQIGVARRVNDNGVKDVCGWISCDNFFIHPNDTIPTEDMESLSYNPIRDIHWRRSGDDGEFVWDNSRYDCLVTNSNKVLVCEESSVLV